MTNTLINYDRLDREVYCFHCKVYSITVELIPTCKNCKSKLITVLKSTITGKKITGAADNIVCFPSFQSMNCKIDDIAT